MLAFASPVAALLLLAFVFITPFSPRWLVSKGRSVEARKVRAGGRAACSQQRARASPNPLCACSYQLPDALCCPLSPFLPSHPQVLRLIRSGSETEVEAELNSIERAVAEMGTVDTMAVLREPWVSWAVQVGVMLAFIQQWTGVNTGECHRECQRLPAGLAIARALCPGLPLSPPSPALSLAYPHPAAQSTPTLLMC